MNCQVVTKVNEVKLKNEKYETRDLEDSDSDGNIHPDSGTDRTRHGIVHECDDVRCETEDVGWMISDER